MIVVSVFSPHTMSKCRWSSDSVHENDSFSLSKCKHNPTLLSINLANVWVRWYLLYELMAHN